MHMTNIRNTMLFLGILFCGVLGGDVTVVSKERPEPFFPIEDVVEQFVSAGEQCVKESIILKEQKEKEEKQQALEERRKSGELLNPVNGIFYYQGQKETYYNLNMSYVVELMQELGYEQSYWVREDGVKMFGDYVMVAADTNRYPKGTIVDTSLGEGMVVDYCESACAYEDVWFDIAVDW